MAESRSLTQTDVFHEVTITGCLDEGFGMARRLLRGPALVPWLATVVGGLLLATAVVLLLGQPDGGLIPMEVHAARRLLTLCRVALMAGILLYAADITWRAYEGVRAPLPRRTSRAGLLARAAASLAILVPAVFLPQLLILGSELISGSTALLPAAWIADEASPGWTGAFVLGLLTCSAARMALPVMVVEGRDPLSALLRGVALSFGHGATPVLVHVSFLLLHLGVGGGLALLMSALLPEDSLAALPRTGGLFELSDLVFLLSPGMLIVEVLLAPQSALSFLGAYIGVRVRREGLDVVRHACGAGLIEEREVR